MLRSIDAGGSITFAARRTPTAVCNTCLCPHKAAPLQLRAESIKSTGHTDRHDAPLHIVCTRHRPSGRRPRSCTDVRAWWSTCSRVATEHLVLLLPSRSLWGRPNKEIGEEMKDATLGALAIFTSPVWMCGFSHRQRTLASIKT